MNKMDIFGPETNWIPAVGIYAMKDGGAVFISEKSEYESFGISYVQILSSGDVIGGGGSFWWKPEEFSRITSPEYILGCQVYHCRKRAKEMKDEADKLNRDAEIYSAAIKALRAAQGEAK